MSAIFRQLGQGGNPYGGARSHGGEAGRSVAIRQAVRDQRAVRIGRACRPCRDRRCRRRARRLAKQNKRKLNWRTSIVDLMKLLDLDSRQAARKKLAEELHYSGDMKDSAKMNVWLHKQLMVKLAANGGKVPEELKH
jgi:hypothetical protein